MAVKYVLVTKIIFYLISIEVSRKMALFFFFFFFQFDDSLRSAEFDRIRLFILKWIFSHVYQMMMSGVQVS